MNSGRQYIYYCEPEEIRAKLTKSDSKQFVEMGFFYINPKNVSSIERVNEGLEENDIFGEEVEINIIDDIE